MNPSAQITTAARRRVAPAVSACSPGTETWPFCTALKMFDTSRCTARVISRITTTVTSPGTAPTIDKAMPDSRWRMNAPMRSPIGCVSGNCSSANSSQAKASTSTTPTATICTRRATSW
ncbi:hypothetical protein D9M72_470870 [compost metagenome]